MKLKNQFKLMLTTAAILATSFATPVHAEALAQRCSLGATCTIPGNDGGLTYIDVTPSSGSKFKCDLKSTKGSMRVWVSGGKDFTVAHGDGYHKVDPAALVQIEGHYKHPENAADVGQIKFRKITGEGTVICSAVRS